VVPAKHQRYTVYALILQMKRLNIEKLSDNDIPEIEVKTKDQVERPGGITKIDLKSKMNKDTTFGKTSMFHSWQTSNGRV